MNIEICGTIFNVEFAPPERMFVFKDCNYFGYSIYQINISLYEILSSQINFDKSYKTAFDKHQSIEKAKVITKNIKIKTKENIECIIRKVKGISDIQYSGNRFVYANDNSIICENDRIKIFKTFNEAELQYRKDLSNL